MEYVDPVVNDDPPLPPFIAYDAVVAYEAVGGTVIIVLSFKSYHNVPAVGDPGATDDTFNVLLAVML